MNVSAKTIILFSSLLLASCNGTYEEGFPQIANPPPFDYADGETLRSTMHSLAFALQRLDSVLLIEDYDGNLSKDEVVDSLIEIERLAKTLKNDDLKDKHPFLLADMSKFISNIERAKWDAGKGRFYRAGRVTGACMSCHMANTF